MGGQDHTPPTLWAPSLPYHTPEKVGTQAAVYVCVYSGLRALRKRRIKKPYQAISAKI